MAVEHLSNGAVEESVSCIINIRQHFIIVFACVILRTRPVNCSVFWNLTYYWLHMIVWIYWLKYTGLNFHISEFAVGNTRILPMHNSLLPSDAIWVQRSEFNLTRVTACFLMTPCRYLSQSMILTSEGPWHSYEINSQGMTKLVKLCITSIEKYAFRFTVTFPRSEWANISAKQQWFPWKKGYLLWFPFYGRPIPKVHLTVL